MTALLIQATIGFAAGVVGGLLGIGGSLVIIPAMVEYMRQTGGYRGDEQHLIQAAAMIVNVFVAAPSVVAHFRAGAIDRQVVKLLIPSALLAMLIGVYVSNAALFAGSRGAYLAIGLAIFLAYDVIYNIWRLRKGSVDHPADAARSAAWRVSVVGTLMGFVGGLLGIGGGALSVPAQQLLLRMPLRRAIANSAATIVCVSAAGALYKNLSLASHGFSARESLSLAAALVPTAMIGSYLGGRLTHVLPLVMLRSVFIVFVTALAWRTFDNARQALTAPVAPASAMPKERMSRQAADNAYLHKDFHGALSVGLDYLDDHYGPGTASQYLRQFALAFYAPLRQELADQGLVAIEEHLRRVYDIEGGAVAIDRSRDELVFAVESCPAVAHMRQHGYTVARCFSETTRAVYEAVCEATPYGFQLLDYEPITGRCRGRFYRRAQSS